MTRLIIATALIALAVSVGDAAPDPHRASVDDTITAACRQAGDAATPRPEHATLRGHLLLIEGGDHRGLVTDPASGVTYLHCVDAWFRARWEREKL